MNNSAKKKVLLVGGGTGGHAAPILAVYKKLREIDQSVQIAITGNGSTEEKKFFDQIPEYSVIRSGKVNRYLTWKNLREAYNVAAGFFEALKYLRKFKPDIIFSKGGYASTPMLLAAGMLKIPYFIHESDISMGQVNRIMSKKAEKVFVCFPVKYFPSISKNKLVQSGPILRQGFGEDVSGSRQYFGFNNDKPVLLVTGGSQGSLALTRAIIDQGEKFLNQFNIIHQAGKHSIEVAEAFKQALDAKLQSSYCLREFLEMTESTDEMLEAMRVADLVVTRSGSTIAELAVLGKPMVLVPWKHSAQNHQEKNARFFAESNAGVIVRDDELETGKLAEVITELFENRAKLTELGKAASRLMPNDGTEMICDTIIEKLKA